jgi:single-strand DNA-binding protein
MASVNKIILVGNLGGDPESRQVGEYTLTKFSIATSDGWGERERTTWHNIEIWGKQAEACAKYLKKGRPVYVEGASLTETWEKDGVKQYKQIVKATDVTFLGSKSDDAPAERTERGQAQGSGRSRGSSEGGGNRRGRGAVADDEDLPF